MRYAFQCEDCGFGESLHQDDLIPLGAYIARCCKLCDGRMRRVASFNFQRPMQPHFNHTVGKPISNDRQFKDELKRKSEANYLRTGFESNLQPVDLHDAKSLGVTDEGLDSTRKRLHDTGEVMSSKRIIV